MPPTNTTPGVYIEETLHLPASMEAVPTAVPAFIGYTQISIDNNGVSLHNTPTLITSLLGFEQCFGKAQQEEHLAIQYSENKDLLGVTINDAISINFNGVWSKHVLYYAVRLYFDNGGGPCYIVSVGLFKALGSSLLLTEMLAGLQVLANVITPTFLVFPEGQKMEEADYYMLLNSALEQCGKLKNRFCIIDIFETGEQCITSNDAILAATRFRNGITTPHLNNGAAYFPNLKTVFPFTFDEAQIAVIHLVNGIQGPFNNLPLSNVTPLNKALYAKLKLALLQYPVVLAPSAAIAGIYAAVDRERGVWKAPANVAIHAISDVTFAITDDVQAEFNVDANSGKSINGIRKFAGRGTLVWGARTLAGNDNEWRYISVRRFFNMVEASCIKALEQFVFEKNDTNTWSKATIMISNFLTSLWKDGALAGNKPEQAFYVSCGLGATMRSLNILEGNMVVEIGLAVIRPSEFILLRCIIKL